MKETIDSLTTNSESLKDKKIIDLAKKNRQLQTQVESYRNKAAKAAEIAVKLADEKPPQLKKQSSSPAKTLPPTPHTQASTDPRVKELEKKVTKLRNENQTLTQQVDRATRLLEREIGEFVDIDQLYKEESAWKGRAQKIEVLKA